MVTEEPNPKLEKPAGKNSTRAQASPAGAADIVSLNWLEEDFENRIGLFKGGRYTSPNKMLGFVSALILTAVFFALMVYVFSGTPGLQRFAIAFIRPRNIYTTIPAMLLFFWAMSLLFIKRQKIRFQVRALELAAVPQEPDFVLNEASARVVLERIHSLVDHPRHFILLNRIERALSNLHNLGGVNEVSTVLKDHAEIDENQIASSYTFVNGMVWSVPVLGFIGTVQGLSSGIANFAKTLEANGDLAGIKAGLQGVTSGLATGFETTLVALVCALIIQLYIHYLQQMEMEFMDQCNDYCQSYVVSKLRLADRLPRVAG
jgi:hypothetical protein